MLSIISLQKLNSFTWSKLFAYKIPAIKHYKYHYIMLVGSLLIFGYIAYHFFHGERGLFALKQLSAKQAAIQQELEEVRAERLNLELRVQHLQPEHLDLDLLDEQARLLLGLAASDEQIILAP